MDRPAPPRPPRDSGRQNRDLPLYTGDTRHGESLQDVFSRARQWKYRRVVHSRLPRGSIRTKCVPPAHPELVDEALSLAAEHAVVFARGAWSVTVRPIVTLRSRPSRRRCAPCSSEHDAERGRPRPPPRAPSAARLSAPTRSSASWASTRWTSSTPVMGAAFPGLPAGS